MSSAEGLTREQQQELEVYLAVYGTAFIMLAVKDGVGRAEVLHPLGVRLVVDEKGAPAGVDSRQGVPH